MWTHNLLTLRARKTKSQALITCSHDHCPWWWAGLSLFIITYSIAISVFVPFFRSLVGIITASTYLLCAYTLPAWFALRLFWGKTLLLERGFLLQCLLKHASTLHRPCWDLISLFDDQ